MYQPGSTYRLNERFRGYLPVVMDLEFSGLDERKHALLEIGVVLLDINDKGELCQVNSFQTHVVPFEGSLMDPKSLEINGIDPFHPLRAAREEADALAYIFKPIKEAVSAAGCTRAIMVGHNASLDLRFLNAAANRCKNKKNPFHPFSCFDTVSLCGLAYGQTVLARASVAAGLEWDTNEEHSALYDARMTAELFCRVVNRWERLHDGLNAPIADGSTLPR